MNIKTGGEFNLDLYNVHFLELVPLFLRDILLIIVSFESMKKFLLKWFSLTIFAVSTFWVSNGCGCDLEEEGHFYAIGNFPGEKTFKEEIIMREKRQDPHHGLQITSVINKAMLALVRNGDYQHPGEAEAIEIIFNDINKNPEQLILDVGCGRGGTADYIFQQGWGKVIGIDINPDIVDTANKNFGQYFTGDLEDLKKGPAFFDCDALDVEEFLFNKFKQKLKFDVICLVSSFFLFPEQEKALVELKKVANKNTKLAIFDYIDRGEYRKHDYKENGKTLMSYLYDLPKIKKLLETTGWKIDSIINLDEENIRWYQDLAQRIDDREDGIISAYGKEAFECFRTRYRHTLDSMVNKNLGGILIYATPI